MAEQTVVIGEGSSKQNGTLFRDGQIPIYFTSDGRFAVQIAGRWIVKSSVKSIENVLSKGAPFLRLFLVDSGISFRSRAVWTIDATAILENKIVDADGKKQHKGYGDYYVYDEEIVAKLRELQKRVEKAERDFNKEMEAVMKKARNVYRGNFDEMLAKYGAKK